MFSGHKRGVYPVIFIPSDEAEEELQPDTLDWDGNKDLVITGRCGFPLCFLVCRFDKQRSVLDLFKVHTNRRRIFSKQFVRH